MLLLNHTQQDELALLHPRRGSLVPDRHVLATAQSPRSEVDEQHLLAAEV